MLESVKKAVAGFFRPPYQNLPWAVLLLLLSMFLFKQDGRYRLGIFYDGDDYMRFVQVFRWIDGASWYDLSEPRLNPPYGTVMHWSRLVDLPLAFAQTLGEWAGLSRHMATQVTAFVIPAVLMLLLFMLVRTMARPFLSRAQSNVAVLFIPFLRYMLMNFSPGRVDHHDYMELIAGYGFVALIRIHLFPMRRFWPVTAGILAGLALWIGAEGFFGLGLFCSALAILLIVEGKRAAAAARWYGASLLLTCCCVLPLARRPSEWLLITYDDFSALYVFVAAIIAVFFYGMGFVSRYQDVKRRLAGAIVIAFALSAICLMAFPSFALLPYAQIDPRLATFFFESIPEMQPVLKTWLHPLSLCLPMTIALLLIAWDSRHWRSWRIIWWLCVWYFLLSYAAALFWAQRVVPYAELFAVVPLTKFMFRLCRTAYPLQSADSTDKKCLVFFLFAILGPIVVPAILTNPPWMNIVFFPTLNVNGSSGCDLSSPAALLNKPPLDEHPRLVLASPMDGARLLFLTKHNVLAGNYHRDTSGNLDAKAIFGARDMGDAEAQIRRRGIDLVLVCRYFEDFYSSPNTRPFSDQYRIIFSQVGAVPIPEPAAMTAQNLADATLIQRLAVGSPPDWLESIPVSADSHYYLYQLRQR